MTKHDKMVQEYLAKGGKITKIPTVESKYEPYTGKLTPTESNKEYHNVWDPDTDSYVRVRKYKNLDKTFNVSDDETIRDYGGR